MTLKFLITTRHSKTEIYNKYGIWDGSNRVRVQAGHTAGNRYHESKAERDKKRELQDLLGKSATVVSMPDPADHHYVIFEALRPVKSEIET